MAVSPFRAVVIAHLQSSLNRMRRQMGRRALWVFVAVLAVLFLTAVAPVVGGISMLGYFAGLALAAPHQDPRLATLVPAAGLFVSALTLLGGAFGGLTGVTRQLPWESLQSFPVSSRELFAGELVAGMGEVLTMIELLSLTGLCAGAAVAAPAASVMFAVLLVCSVLTLLSTQLLVGSLAQRLSKQARVMFAVLPLLALMLSSLLPRLADHFSKHTVTSGIDRVLALAALLPAARLVEGAGALLEGRYSEVPVRALPLVLLTLALVISAWFAVSRESPLSTIDSGQRAQKLWTFTHPVYGVARLQWESLASSMAGRFGLLMPLLTIVLVRGPMAEVVGRGDWLIPASFSYCALASTNLMFNQFGLDRHGVKTLFLLPIDEVTLLRGKLFGFIAWHSIQVLMLSALLALTGHGQPLKLLLGFCFYCCFFLTLSMVGQFSSLWQPRPMGRGGMRAAQPPLVVMLLTSGTLLSAGAVFFGVLWLLRLFAPAWELPVFALLVLMLAVTSQVVLLLNAKLLERSREKLVDALGAGV